MSSGRRKTRRQPTRTTAPVLGTYYHFTSRLHLPLIVAAKVITTTESHVGSGRHDWPPHGQHVGPDVVWLLDVPEVEYPHGLDGSVVDKTGVRFTVQAAAYRWLDWPPAQSMHPEWRHELIKLAGGWAAARRWWVSERPIPADDWQVVDVLPPREQEADPVPDRRAEQASS